jgi:hypothetical protein
MHKINTDKKDVLMNTSLSVGLLCICAILFSSEAGDTLISVTGPCQYGDFWLESAETNENGANSVTFSCGLTIRCHWGAYSSYIPEPEPTYGAIIFDTIGITAAGMRFDTAIVPWEKWVYNEYLSHSVNDPNVVWDSAMFFPDQLYPLDTLPNWSEYNFEEETVPLYFGRWCMENYRTQYPNEELAFWIENHDAILYAICKDGTRMKLQIFDRKTDNWFTSTNCSRFKSIRIRWAVDGFGNGVFEHPNQVRAHSSACNMSPYSSNKLIVYDIRGRIIHRNAIHLDFKKTSGIYVLKQGKNVQKYHVLSY